MAPDEQHSSVTFEENVPSVSHHTTGGGRRGGHRGSAFRRTFLSRSNLMDASARSQAEAETLSRFRDHFTLQAPTTVVKFGDNKSAARIIHNEDSQLVLEENYDKDTRKRHVSIKLLKEEGGVALKILRGFYTLFGFFFVGFLFAIAAQVILFVILDLAIQMGFTEIEEPSYGYSIGVFLAFPFLIHGFALALMVAGTFVWDLWMGHPLFARFVLPSFPREAVEWIFLSGLVIAPVIVMCGSLIAGSTYWWQVGSLFWFFAILFFYAAFGLSILWYESWAFVKVVNNSMLMGSDDSFAGKVFALIALRMRYTLSGYSKVTYSSFGSPDTAFHNSRDCAVPGTLREKQGLYARLTQWSCLGCMYETLDEPIRMNSIDDVTANRPYETSYSWDLEKFFCKPLHSRYIAILEGPGAMTTHQFNSSLACAVVGLALIYLVLIAILAYNNFNFGQIALAFIVLLVLSVPFSCGPVRVMSEVKRLKLLKAASAAKKNREQESGVPSLEVVMEEDPVRTNGTNDSSEGPLSEDAELPNGENEEADPLNEKTNRKKGLADVFDHVQGKIAKHGKYVHKTITTTTNQLFKESDISWGGFSNLDGDISVGCYFVTEKYRITEPSITFGYFWFIMLLLLFLVWPCVSLYSIEGWQLATVYLALAVVSVTRFLTNPGLLLEEMGELFVYEGMEDAAKFEMQSRLCEVASTISRGASYKAWRFVLLVFTLVMLGLGVHAVAIDETQDESKIDVGLTFLPDFQYERQDSLHYMTCDMTQTLEGSFAASLADFAFLSKIAYNTNAEVDILLKEWYRGDDVYSKRDVVDEFRSRREVPSNVEYKLFVYNENGDERALVSVRGTKQTWDMLADGQLWGGASLMQMVRAAIAFGFMWTPILDEIVTLLGGLQSGTIEKVSYYKETTNFVNYLLETGNYSSVSLTGHSLGGGISIISGAQTGVEAVAISGPNALLSRHRFGVTQENLERYTFNVVPDRDPIPQIDDPVKNIQKIECRTPQNDWIGCHTIGRTLCELLFQCGSDRRPVPCECYTEFGYPKPSAIPGANRTFEDACAVSLAENKD